MILFGAQQQQRIRSKALGTKMEKDQAYGTLFATPEGKFTTMTLEMSHAIATTKSTRI